MTTLIPKADMTVDEVIRCSYDAMALVDLCSAVSLASEAGLLGEEQETSVAGNISAALTLALKLMGPVHDLIECNDKLLKRAR